jgi:hypothetical protein
MNLKRNIKEIIDNAIFSSDEIKNIINNRIDSIINKISTIKNNDDIEFIKDKQFTMYEHKNGKTICVEYKDSSLIITMWSKQHNGAEFYCKENVLRRIHDRGDSYKFILDVKYVDNFYLYLRIDIYNESIHIKIFDDQSLLAVLFSKYPRLFPNAPEIDEALEEYRFSDDYGMDYINTMFYKDQIIEFLSILEDFLTDPKKFRKCSEHEMRNRNEDSQL